MGLAFFCLACFCGTRLSVMTLVLQRFVVSVLYENLQLKLGNLYFYRSS